MTSRTRLDNMNDKYTFASTPIGRAIRKDVADSLHTNGITTEDGQETVTAGGVEYVLLTLTVTGKRPGAGRIAQAMKKGKP